MFNLFNSIKRNSCKECVYYYPENNTCQCKKVAMMGYGYVTLIERMFCEPYKGDNDYENDAAMILERR